MVLSPITTALGLACWDQAGCICEQKIHKETAVIRNGLIEYLQLILLNTTALKKLSIKRLNVLLLYNHESVLARCWRR